MRSSTELAPPQQAECDVMRLGHFARTTDPRNKRPCWGFGDVLILTDGKRLLRPHTYGDTWQDAWARFVSRNW